MKCPMKMANPQRKGCGCERDACAWLVERMGEKGATHAGCAVMLAQGPTAVYERSYVLAKE